MGMIANLQNTMFNAIAGSMAGGGGALPGGDGQNVSLFTSPLFHVSGCHSTLVVGLLAGLRLVMLDSKFEPDKALQLIEDEGVKVWATVPTMVWRVCEYPGRYDYDTSTVESVAFGGSPSADELIRKIRDTFPNVKVTTNAYGLTESSSVATVLSGPDADRKPDSVGTPMPVVDLKIADEAGTALPTGETGEVLHRRSRSSCPATGTSPRRPPKPSATAGSTRATSATSTTRATCSSPTARRT